VHGRFLASIDLVGSELHGVGPSHVDPIADLRDVEKSLP
jgi:hypothetical protein